MNAIPEISKEYHCSICNESCGEVNLCPDNKTEGYYMWHLLGFIGSVHHHGISKQDAAVLADLLKKDALQEIADINDLFVPFHCYECKVNYCLAHWSSWAEFDDGFYDAHWGICPHGHKQMLND